MDEQTDNSEALNSYSVDAKNNQTTSEKYVKDGLPKSQDLTSDKICDHEVQLKTSTAGSEASPAGANTPSSNIDQEARTKTNDTEVPDKVDYSSSDKMHNNKKVENGTGEKLRHTLHLTPGNSIEDNVFEDNNQNQAGQSAKLPTTPCVLSNKQEKVEPEERVPVEMLVRRSRTESMDSLRRSRTESMDSNPERHLEILTFHVPKPVEVTKEIEEKEEDNCVCLLCDRSYSSEDKEDALAHLVVAHKFVIADVGFIGSLPEYMKYWKKRFSEKPYTEFCSKIITNASVKNDESREEFYLLCDALPEDKELREALQRKKLEGVLAQQQKEREETKFCRQCLFCKQTYCGNRAVMIDHLVKDHSFHVGQPDNLVYTDEMFDLIQSKLDRNLCLFCEKDCEDNAGLKEHMRKKQHRKINPKHKEYDRFYIVNYMELGKNWKNLKSEDNRLVKESESTINEEDEWSGWNEEMETFIVCLFCETSYVAVADLDAHMKERHKFDLHEICQKLQLDFYKRVKMINFIRRKVYEKICYGCHQTFETSADLHNHFDECLDHIQKIPEAEEWDQDEFFFPTYEDDSLLCSLDDEEDDDGDENNPPKDLLDEFVIKEDMPAISAFLLNDKKLCRHLRKA